MTMNKNFEIINKIKFSILNRFVFNLTDENPLISPSLEQRGVILIIRKPLLRKGEYTSKEKLDMILKLL